jgi:NADPH:quinone reductase-like Zn-dependent oxidoreductase
VLPVPEGVSLIDAAAIPEVYATVWLNLFQLAALKPGEKVLLHAGASGIGSAAIQLCKAFGNPTWVSVGSAERLAYCEALGAQGGVVRSVDLEALRDLGPFDVILDPVGGNYAELNIKVAALDARWVMIGLMGGTKAQVDLGAVLGKRIHLLGSTLRSRSDQFKADLLSDLGQHVWPLFTEGRLSPQVVRTFPIVDAETAFDELAGNQISGKVVLIVDETLI